MIRPVSYAEIFNAPNAAELLREYAAECMVDYGEPQQQMYAELESMGRLKCFAAYSGEILVGLVSLLVGTIPHHGNRLAAIESIFVLKDHRDSGTADRLIEAAEACAGLMGCRDVVATARKGSAFDQMLSRRTGWDLTHSQHTRHL